MDWNLRIEILNIHEGITKSVGWNYFRSNEYSVYLWSIEEKEVSKCSVFTNEWKIRNARGLSRPLWKWFAGTQLVALPRHLKSTFPPLCKYYFEVKMKFLPALPFTPWRIHQRLNDTLVTTRGRRVYLAYPTSTRELIKNLSLNDTDDFERRLSRNVLVWEQISWTSATSSTEKVVVCRLSRERIFNLPTCSVIFFFFFFEK